MKLYGVCGEPIIHSLSPQIYNQLFALNNIDSYYTRILAHNSEEAMYLFNVFELAGMNITSPFKHSFINFCNSITDDAKSVGCINTILRHKTGILGFNTDWEGVITSLQNKFNPATDANLLKRVTHFPFSNILVVGSGGAASAAIFALQKIYPTAKITIMNRSTRNAKFLATKYSVSYFVYREFATYDLTNFDLIIITTPEPERILESIHITTSAALMFSNYGGENITKFLEKNHFKFTYQNCIFGLEWLVNQAIPAFEYFIGNDDFCKNISIENDAFIEHHHNYYKHNIYLVGFSGSGKTVVGKYLSDLLKRTFIDTDHLVSIQHNYSVNDIINKEGEITFRRYEMEVVEKISKKQKCVVSLGGGTILSSENQRIIKESGGFIIYLYSDIATIMQRIDINTRPILKNKTDAQISEMFLSRREKYFTAADLVVYNNDCDARSTAERIFANII